MLERVHLKSVDNECVNLLRLIKETRRGRAGRTCSEKSTQEEKSEGEEKKESERGGVARCRWCLAEWQSAGNHRARSQVHATHCDKKAHGGSRL